MNLKNLILFVALLTVMSASPALAALTVSPSLEGGNTLTENNQVTVSVTVANTGNAESNIIVSLTSSPSWFSVTSACTVISSLQKDQSGASSCIITPTGTGASLSLTATARSDGGTEGSGSVSGITVNSDTATLTAQMSGDSSVSRSSTFFIGVTVTAPSTKDSANVITTISQSSGSCTIDTSYVSASQNIGNITKSTSKSPTAWKVAAPSSAGTCVFSVSVASDNTGSAAPTKSVTVTAPGGGSSSDSSSGSSSSSGYSGTAGAAAANKSSEKKSDKAADKSVPPGIANNTKLLDAIEKVLAKGKLSQSAIDNLNRLSELIRSDVTTDRKLVFEGNNSILTEKVKYSGAKKIKNFMVHEKIPKEFAAKAGDIAIFAITYPQRSQEFETAVLIKKEGNIEVVETDPEFLITFAEALPNQEFIITYAVNAAVSGTVLDSVSSQVYAESAEEVPSAQPIALVTKDYITITIIVLLIVLFAAGVFIIRKRVKREKAAAKPKAAKSAK